MSTLLHMARWAHSVSIADVPPALRERLRLQAASTLAAAAAGVHSEDAQIALTVARRMGAGSHRIAPGVDGLTMEGALFAGASLSMAHDYDDWMLCAHPSHSAVWAAWVGAAELGLGWDAALRAQIVANEILARLGGYCLPGRQNGQSWSFLHGVGGALVGGLLRGHSPEQLASGMALTLAQASHVDWRLFSGPGKTLMAARPLLDGWRVAELVEEGVTGPVGLLDEDSEFTSVFAGGRPVRGWFSGLPVEDPSGTAWLTWSLTVKCVPGCDYLTAAVEATKQVLEEVRTADDRVLGPDDILRVDVDCGALTSAMERVVGGLELSPSAVNYSVRRSIAVLLIAGELGPQQLTRAWVADHSEAIDSLAEKIRVHHDWRLSLASWNALRGTGVQRLLTEVGPGPLLSALGRGGGLEAGLSLTELPLAIAGDRLQGVPPDELPALFGRGLSKLTDFAARGLERLLPAAVTPRRSDEFDLAEQSLEGLHVVFPARVRVLLHGGHVHQAAVDEPAGSPARPPEERRAAVRAKLLQALLQADPTDQARHHSLAEALLGVGNARGTHLTPLPGDGPAFLLGG